MKTLKTALILALTGIVCGLLIGATNLLTAPIIQRNLEKRAMRAYQDFFELDAIETKEAKGSYVYEYVEIKKDDKTVGHIFKAKGTNQRGVVDIVVAVETNGKLKGVKIIDTENTVGFYDQYEGSDGNLTGLIGNEIDNLAGIDLIGGVTQTGELLDKLLKDVNKEALNYMSVDLNHYEDLFGEGAVAEVDSSFTPTELVTKKEIVKDASGNVVGHAYTATGNADEDIPRKGKAPITLLVGIDLAGKVKGVIAIDVGHTDTPTYFGNYYAEFDKQSGKELADLAVDVVGGASISGRLINVLLDAVKAVAANE